MRSLRMMASFAALVLVGAGCVASAPAAPSATGSATDATPYVNEANCRNSGGTVDGDSCDCPDGYAPDPAGFCLDAQRRPGGSMAPKS